MHFSTLSPGARRKTIDGMNAGLLIFLRNLEYKFPHAWHEQLFGGPLESRFCPSGPPMTSDD